MLKIFGSVLIVLACGLSGLAIAKNYIRRPHELRCLQSALQMLETEISYAASPLAEAMEIIAARCDKHVAMLFLRAKDELSSMSGYTAKEAWDKSLDAFYPQTALNQTDLSILRSLGGTLGISDREDQIKHLRLSRAQLKAEMDKADELARRNVKLWNYLGFSGGIVIVLILF
ncbi:stage III sporulation protein SpoIIIAB [Desulfolucanica intricata]|uniref:stage III sporulation protein SpoIIIAB n=1 Tax=Desulfolucanica intricata TaxID=1285191 RepID=UPI0008311920|nr:stage III sporulation protein SpoIIIAB [Desulfolucanica intricata]